MSCHDCEGKQGPAGPQGPQGVQGIQGPQGQQGIPGKDCCHEHKRDGGCCERYANVYASKPLVIGPFTSASDTVVFDSKNEVSSHYNVSVLLTPPTAASAASAANAAVIAAGGTPAQATAASNAVLADVGKSYEQAAKDAAAAVIASGGSPAQAHAAFKAVWQSAPVISDFDLSLMGSTGDIKFLKSGIYHISWQLQGSIVPPVAVPVPSWSFSFYLNGVLVNGSCYSGWTQAPADQPCHSTGEVIVKVLANTLLRLRNTSISAVNLNPAVTGSVVPITIASISIECLKDLM